MRKKLLALAFFTTVGVMTNSLSANLTVDKTVLYSDIYEDGNDAVRQTPLAYNNDNQLYTTGCFSKPFGGIENVGSSAFLMKSDAELNQLWKVAIVGSATITTVLCDGDDVYIAGVFADEIEVGTTSGQTAILEGYKMYGAYGTKQSASFIAKYNADGKLIEAKAIVPEENPNLVATGMYFPEDGDVYCSINNLTKVNGKLYASAVFTGKLNNIDASQNVIAGYLDAFWGGFWFQDQRALAVIELNERLLPASFLFSMRGPEVTGDAQQVSSVAMTSNGNNLYLGVVATGEETYTFAGKEEKLSFFTDGFGTVGYGHIIFALNPTEGTYSKKEWETVTADEFQINFIKNLSVKDESIFVSGTFNETLAFDPTKSATGADDMYVVALNKNDLSLKWSAVTGFDEGETTKNEEIMTSVAANDSYIFINGYSSLKSDHSFTNPLQYSIDVTTGNIEKLNSAEYVFGMASSANARKVATSSSIAPFNDLKFSSFNVTTSSESIIADSQETGFYYNKTNKTIYFSEICDANIYTAAGQSVLSSKKADNINAASLNKGIYIIKIEGSSKAFKFVIQ